MIRFEQTIDALNHAREFHYELSEFYNDLSKCDIEDKARLLLEYMVENEKVLAQALVDYEEQAPDAVLNTWFQYTNDADILKLPDSHTVGGVRSVDDIVELAMKFSDELVQLYAEMSDHSGTAELKEMFDNLVSMQTQEKRKLSINVDRLMDL